MRLQPTPLRSKVGRRLLVLFVLCALVPVATLSLLSFTQVSEHLYRQSEQRLRQASKATGMKVLDRLIELEAELASLEGAAAIPDDLHHRLRALTRVTGEGEPIALLGERLELPEIGPADADHLAAGKSLIEILDRAAGSPLVVMIRRAADRGLVVAQLNGDWLFDISYENTLPTAGDFCVLDGRRRVIASSWEAPVVVPPSVEGALDDSVSGHFEWSHPTGRFLAAQWSLFLKGLYGAPEWTFVIAEPRDLVLAPVANFRLVFPLVTAGSLCAVVLLSVAQIRRRLLPLEKLRDATRRIASRDFDVDVRIQSGDEFEELGDSFNAMAHRLNEHFDLLATMIEIDRDVLSAMEPTAIATTVLARVPELHPCDFRAVLLPEPETRAGSREFVAHVATSGDARAERVELSDRELRTLETHPERLVLAVDENAPAYLQSLLPDGIRTLVLLPLVVNKAVAGLVVLGRRERDEPETEKLTYARQLADQAAIALSNARAIEEKRVLAYFDRVTGLPNRVLFKERLELALERSRGRSLAVCIVELDDFKRINDTLGHGLGDAVLKEVGQRISRALSGGTAARLGGDEFAVLLDEIEGFDDAARVAGRVLETIAHPYRVSGQEVFVTASIGISVHPQDGDRVETLVQNANQAMYAAKESGKNCYQFFTESMNETALKRLSLENAMRRALDSGEFELAYQPVVEVASRDVVGFEALLRWRDPELGVVPPSEFIPLAEEIGLIASIGSWALRTACRQSRAWQDAGLPPVRVAVNLSSRQFNEAGLLDEVVRALEDAELPAQLLGLELTESMLMQADAAMLHTLECFREMGVRLSLDDFGTGYSSLSYLKKFPLDNLKIDRSFVKDLPEDADDAAITRAVIGMARSLGLQVIAEGVETEAQLAFLRNEGCDAAQGFLFGEALAPDGAAKLLEQRRPE